ncbi:hypothetical protein EC957_002605 [Mortierella hygrophila]|uniref:Argonaute linker 1 domain-containing protein n=1 Tax=Mortierella hygrophila TaxID=979708 RepID=A0A9P6F3B1_9FUNG|nr:hypothetical protein EC957_002605 [Mortierella hygrophila]
MSTPCEQFFDIRELVDLLSPHLSLKDVSHLSRTSKRTHHTSLPSLFRYLEVRGNNKIKIFSSVPGLYALARNIGHVRILELETDELVFYYHCVLAFEELNLGTLQGPLPRPSWLPLPDIHACQLVALPPMTCLSELTIQMGLFKGCSYTLPSARDPRASFAQLCWLVSINAGLSLLDLESVPVKDLAEGRRLGRVIAGLSKIRQLRLGIICSDDDYLELGSLLLFSCQPSIQGLAMTVSLNSKDGNAPHHSSHWQEESEDAIAVLRTKEPLVHLEVLMAHYLRDCHSLTAIHTVFAHCPNIRKLGVTIAGDLSANIVGPLIAMVCHKIESLTYGDVNATAHDPVPFKILDSLPARQVTEFLYSGLLSNVNAPEVNLSLLRHSTTLRRIVVQGHGIHGRISLSAILSECQNLEILHIKFNSNAGHYITLSDAVEARWRCTKLSELVLSISGCDLPTLRQGILAYYIRPSPVTLTPAETQHFARLEILYKQIGKLTSLQALGLHMVILGRHERVDRELQKVPRSFPALMSIGDPFGGRPGYLHHLSGLKKLERLEGSVRMDTEETKLTVDWPEASWMSEHWPLLRRAKVFARGGEIRYPFKWLQDQRKRSGREKLVTLASYVAKVLDPARPASKSKVKIRKAVSINLEELHRFLNERTSLTNTCLTAIIALDVLIRRQPAMLFATVGRFFYTTISSQVHSGPLDVWLGYYQSVRPTLGMLSHLLIFASVYQSVCVE